VPAPSRRHAASLLCTARLERARIDSLPEDVRPANELEAYVVQSELHEQLAELGWGSVAGHKIGCTTAVMQSYMGIDHPCAGGIFAPTMHRATAGLEHAAYVRPGVECEVAVRLGADLGPSSAPFDRKSTALAVAACMAAIEIVDDRYSDYSLLGTPTLIADDFFGAGCVLAPEVEGFDPLQLDQVSGTMWVDGEEVGSGVGADVLGLACEQHGRPGREPQGGRDRPARECRQDAVDRPGHRGTDRQRPAGSGAGPVLRIVGTQQGLRKS
jgi:2-keto-4-pentenoate hydratase